MTNFFKNHADMTNAEFEKMLRQECENRELQDVLEKIRGVLDEHY